MKNNDGTPKTHKLRLLIEVDGIYADDLEACAESMDCTVYEALEEELRMECTLTIINLPGDGNLNDDFGITAHSGRIVGAQVVPIDDRYPFDGAVTYPSSDAPDQGQPRQGSDG